jgi:hypothetical protein
MLAIFKVMWHNLRRRRGQETILRQHMIRPQCSVLTLVGKRKGESLTTHVNVYIQNQSSATFFDFLTELSKLGVSIT